MAEMGQTGKGMAWNRLEIRGFFFKVEDKEKMSNVWPNRNMSIIRERLDVW
jgi:hypothetical protein